jgi:DNA polymerase III epsilon subunit-like protein
MTAPLCFIDTETTSLRPDRRAWEIGIIRRNADGTEEQQHWFIDADSLDLGNADLMSLKIGRFYERHPQMDTGISGEAFEEPEAMWAVESFTRGAHLVGAVVSFDAEVLSARMRANGICPSWHYHLIDVEALVVGYLARTHHVKTGKHQLITPPWKSDDLSAELGITVSDEDRHTALGDARWAMRIYDTVMGGAA